jgi:hypothetical protein
MLFSIFSVTTSDGLVATILCVWASFWHKESFVTTRKYRIVCIFLTLCDWRDVGICNSDILQCTKDVWKSFDRVHWSVSYSPRVEDNRRQDSLWITLRCSTQSVRRQPLLLNCRVDSQYMHKCDLIFACKESIASTASGFPLFTDA